MKRGETARRCKEAARAIEKTPFGMTDEQWALSQEVSRKLKRLGWSVNDRNLTVISGRFGLKDGRKLIIEVVINPPPKKLKIQVWCTRILRITPLSKLMSPQQVAAKLPKLQKWMP